MIPEREVEGSLCEGAINRERETRDGIRDKRKSWYGNEGKSQRVSWKEGGRFTDRYVRRKIEKSLWRRITHAPY